MPASNVAAEKRSQPQILVETAGLSEEEWLAYRRKGIGGSDVAALLGISPWRTARDLYFDKLNIVAVEDNEDNWVALEMGHLLESLVAKIFQHRTGYKVYQIKKMFQHPQYSWMLADVDYFVELPDGSTAILEIKTTNYNARDNWWLNGEETVPVYYEAQGRHYMAVMNVDRCFFCCLYGNNEEETIIREIRRDESYEEEMIFLEQYFWENHVLTRTPPPYTEDGDLVLESVRRHTGSADQDAPVVTLDLSLTAKLMRYVKHIERERERKCRLYMTYGFMLKENPRSYVYCADLRCRENDPPTVRLQTLRAFREHLAQSEGRIEQSVECELDGRYRPIHTRKNYVTADFDRPIVVWLNIR